jgi:hypothetical protein
VAKYAIATAAAMRAAKARMACSRPGFFFDAGGAGGVDSRRSLVEVSDVLTADDLGAVRLGERGVACLGAIGAGSGLLGLLGVAATVVDVGLGGAERARALALRARISLRCARDGFLLTIRRYSKQVRSGKTPALWVMKPPALHNVSPTS